MAVSMHCSVEWIFFHGFLSAFIGGAPLLSVCPSVDPLDKASNTLDPPTVFIISPEGILRLQAQLGRIQPSLQIILNEWLLTQTPPFHSAPLITYPKKKKKKENSIEMSCLHASFTVSKSASTIARVGAIWYEGREEQVWYLFNDSKQIIKAAHALKHRKEKFIKWIGFICLGGSSHYHWHDNTEPLADIRLPWR